MWSSGYVLFSSCSCWQMRRRSCWPEVGEGSTGVRADHPGAEVGAIVDSLNLNQKHFDNSETSSLEKDVEKNDDEDSTHKKEEGAGYVAELSASLLLLLPLRRC
jgi:hypothetical protein